MTNDQRDMAAPQGLQAGASMGTPGSIEDAIAGRYEFDIGDVMSEAWRLVKGFKGTFWAAAILIYLMALVSGFIWARISIAVFGVQHNGIGPAIFNGLIGTFMMPLFAGVTAMVVKRAAGMPVSFSTAFAYLGKVPVLAVAGLLTTLMTYLGFALLIIPGIYLAVAYVMTMPLIALNNLGAWQAMEISRKAIGRRWFDVFGLNLRVGLLVMLSALPLGIPLIWTMPWAALVVGVLYRRIFGLPAPDA
ncbi:MAG TPA: hypothetical protein VI456_14945 [Polyangia bacterium]